MLDETTLRIALLRALGFEQAELARLVGVSQQTVSRRLKALRGLAKASANPEAFAAVVVLMATTRDTRMRESIAALAGVDLAGGKPVPRVRRASKPRVRRRDA